MHVDWYKLEIISYDWWNQRFSNDYVKLSQQCANYLHAYVCTGTSHSLLFLLCTTDFLQYLSFTPLATQLWWPYRIIVTVLSTFTYNRCLNSMECVETSFDIYGVRTWKHYFPFLLVADLLDHSFHQSIGVTLTNSHNFDLWTSSINYDTCVSRTIGCCDS